ncbi:MAG: hypothetical protein ACLPKB_32375 [Xanthobacteraceae bacterium]
MARDRYIFRPQGWVVALVHEGKETVVELTRSKAKAKKSAEKLDKKAKKLAKKIKRQAKNG